MTVTGYGERFFNVRSDELRGLANLTTLDFSDNDITWLPENFFRGVSGLVSVDFSGNPAPITLTGEVVDQDFNAAGDPQAFIVRNSHGAPFDMEFGLSATLANPREAVQMYLDGSADTAITKVTIPRGATDSPLVRVKRATGATGTGPLAGVRITNLEYVDPLAGDTDATPFADRKAGLLASFNPAVLDVKTPDGPPPLPPPLPLPQLSISADGRQILEDDDASEVTVTLQLNRAVVATDGPIHGHLALSYKEPAALNGIDYRISHGGASIPGDKIQFDFGIGESVKTFEITPIKDGDLEPMLEDLVIKLWEGGVGYTRPSVVADITVSVNEGICDRTPQVETAIYALMPAADREKHCNDSTITPEYLEARKGTLDVIRASALQSLDLRHLTGVRGLDLRDSARIKRLPYGLFDGITLTRLRTSRYAQGLRWSANLERTRVENGNCHMDFRADVGFPFPQLIQYEVDLVEEEDLLSETYNSPGVRYVQDFLEFVESETVAAQVVAVYARAQFFYPEKRITFVEHPFVRCTNAPRSAAARGSSGTTGLPTVSVTSSGSGTRQTREAGSTEAAGHDTLHVTLDSSVDWDVHVPFWVTKPSGATDSDLGEELVGFSWATVPAGQIQGTMNLDLEVLRGYTTDIPSDVTYQLSPPKPTVDGYNLSGTCTTAKKSGSAVTDVCGTNPNDDDDATAVK